MNLPSRCGSVSSSLRVYFGRCSRKGLFLCDRESAAADLFGILFVYLWHYLLKGGGIESLCQNGSPSDNILPGFQFFGIPVQHFGFDFIPECFGLGFCFCN